MATAKKKKENDTCKGTKKEENQNKGKEPTTTTTFENKDRQTHALKEIDRTVQIGTPETTSKESITKENIEKRRKGRNKRKKRNQHKGKENNTGTICRWIDPGQNESDTRSKALPSTRGWF